MATVDELKVQLRGLERDKATLMKKQKKNKRDFDYEYFDDISSQIQLVKQQIAIQKQKMV